MLCHHCEQDPDYNNDCQKDCKNFTGNCCIESTTELKDLTYLSKVNPSFGVQVPGNVPTPAKVPSEETGGSSIGIIVGIVIAVIVAISVALCLRSRQLAEKRQTLSLENVAAGSEYIPPSAKTNYEV